MSMGHVAALLLVCNRFLYPQMNLCVVHEEIHKDTHTHRHTHTTTTTYRPLRHSPGCEVCTINSLRTMLCVSKVVGVCGCRSL